MFSFQICQENPEELLQSSSRCLVITSLFHLILQLSWLSFHVPTWPSNMHLLKLVWMEGYKATSALGTSWVNVGTVFEKQSLMQKSVLLTSEMELLLLCDHSQYLSLNLSICLFKPMSFSPPCYSQGFWPSFSDTASQRYQILKQTSGWMGQEVGADRVGWNVGIAWGRVAATGKVELGESASSCWHPELATVKVIRKKICCLLEW